MKRDKVILPVLFVLLFCTSVSGQEKTSAEASLSVSDSPNYLGINRDGVSPEKGLLRKWPEKGPKELWRVPIRLGWSCPVVAGEDLVLTSSNYVSFAQRAGEAFEKVLCLNAMTGKRKWETEYKIGSYGGGWLQGNPRSTPVIKDDAVYTLGVNGHLTRFERKTGKILWQYDAGKEVCSVAELIKMNVYGYSQSPVVLGDTVAIAVYFLNKEPAILGIDAKSGKQSWLYKDKFPADKKAIDPGTLSVCKISGQECLLAYFGKGFIALNPVDGKKVWRSQPAGNKTSMNPAPLIISGNKLLLTPVTGDTVKMYDFDRNLSSPEPKMQWEAKELRVESDCVPFICHNGAVFGYNVESFDPNYFDKRTCSLVCLDERTGKIRWKSETWTAPLSMLAADGLLFVRNFRTLRLVEATAAGYKELGKIENIHDAIGKNFDEPSMIDYVLPVIANGKLYIRLPAELLCLDIKNN